MKIRNGFVSNSSSSSFIVSFPHVPESIQEVHDMLYDQLEVLETYSGGYSTTSLQVAEQVFQDILSQNPNDRKAILEAFQGGSLDGAPDLDDYKIPDKKSNWGFRWNWEAYNKAEEAFEKNFMDNFMKNHAKSFVFTFHYGDNDGAFFSIMEHSGIFDKLDYVRNSKH